ncbi:AAA family ATPase [Nocardioides sp. WL0053]|uniref:AAA family ATPase n=1 Tax=Nocardioides jiangsuensis TaxID=2866161 RepID=A0ABS7RKL6_9ACTN|nr:ArsA-related P-loop ATPase [Nocardioides jiangsuensis]MBY9074380.1 AAA family ATPase [Nocardioides jiangsuensis]
MSSTTPNETDWEDVLLHVVTGKGGTGKTTVAAALALALASRGKTVLLCEVEGRQGIAQLFDVPPLPYEERRVASGPNDGGDVYALAIEPEAALLEYLDMYYRLGRAGKALDRFGVVDFATTIAPGVRDVLLTGKVYEAAYRNKRSKGARRYDAIVLDAPPTGRIAQFLNVNSELAGLAKVGPIRTQADSIMTLLRSPRTAVHLVTVLEDMPVQETADGIAELHAAKLPVGGVVVNLVRSNELDDEARDQAVEDGLPRGLIEEDLRRVGIEPTGTMLDGLLTEAREHAERRDLEDEQRKRINELDVDTYELPRLTDGIDLGGLYELAADLCEQGMA